MARRRTRIEGKKKLDAQLSRLIDDMSIRKTERVLMEGGKVYERGAKLRITTQGLVDTGNLRAATIAEPVSTRKVAAVEVGPRGIRYAAIHEFGGTLRPRVTPKMRRWAWFKFRSTGKPVFRAIALTRKSHLTIRIKARPYMRPTFDQDTKAAEKAMLKFAKRKIID